MDDFLDDDEAFFELLILTEVADDDHGCFTSILPLIVFTIYQSLLR